ncbi:glycosyltransferase family 2 protein [Mucilaginibacter antarcticus]|uniref:glycosyltransferase family 2 protein n=1 Tax=Mucilaginibacter antarcticus TaxID=1855725 RepID=UPI003626958E
MKVTVLMPVYNGGECLKQAIESILSQSFTDYELLIINDASIDDSEKVIKSFIDPRIRYLKNDGNKGLVETLNLGLREATGQYIARMDQDDICHNDRLKLQVKFLDSHAEIGVCGTGAHMFGDRNFNMFVFESSKEIAIQLIFNSPLIHPTVMLRKELLDKNNLRYDPLFSHAEDFAFWAELSKWTQIYNIPQVLINYRWHQTNYSTTKFEEQRVVSNSIRIKYITDSFGINISEAEIGIHKKICELDIFKENEITEAYNWLIKLVNVNNGSNKFDEKLFSWFISFTGKKYWSIVTALFKVLKFITATWR